MESPVNFSKIIVVLKIPFPPTEKNKLWHEGMLGSEAPGVISSHQWTGHHDSLILRELAFHPLRKNPVVIYFDGLFPPDLLHILFSVSCYSLYSYNTSSHSHIFTSLFCYILSPSFSLPPLFHSTMPPHFRLLPSFTFLLTFLHFPLYLPSSSFLHVLCGHLIFSLPFFTPLPFLPLLLLSSPSLTVHLSHPCLCPAIPRSCPSCHSSPLLSSLSFVLLPSPLVPLAFFHPSFFLSPPSLPLVHLPSSHSSPILTLLPLSAPPLHPSTRPISLLSVLSLYFSPQRPGRPFPSFTWK